jgi:hypothetical protein
VVVSHTGVKWIEKYPFAISVQLDGTVTRFVGFLMLIRIWQFGMPRFDTNDWKRIGDGLGQDRVVLG